MNQHPEFAQNLSFHQSDKFAPEGQQKVALVDIDETICFYGEERRYDKAIGHMANIAKINQLHDEGWYII